MSGTGSRLPLAPFLTGLAAVLAPLAAGASANHAHHHYHMGVRAYAGTRHAAALHHETLSGTLDLALAREDAADMVRLAADIADRVERLAKVWTPREAEAIGPEMDRLRTLAGRAGQQSRELGKWLETRIAGGGETPSGESRDRIVRRSRELFALFSEMLRAHKLAEAKLGIPVPRDPPAPGE